jgi:hypothetical protein
MRAIDAWVNVRLGPPAPWQKTVAETVFNRPASDVFRAFTVAETIEMMDRLDVERAILTVRAERADSEVLEFVERHPSRFQLSATVDPTRGMRALRDLEALHKTHPLALARVIPCLHNLAPNDRVYYPLYAKCIELGLPISVNTGIPAPMLPGRCQDPIALDDVCLFFPDLKIIMANGADPWWSVAVRLMVKYKNLYLMTSGFAPKYLPAELLEYMRTRGQEKIIFASDFPFLTIERCLSEAKSLALDEAVLEKYLYSNAAGLFAPPAR